MATMKCSNCQNAFILPKDRTTITCPFCNTIHLISSDELNSEQSVESIQLEKYYQSLIQKAKTYRDIKVLSETADEFYRLGTYKDSLKYAEYCLERIKEEEQKQIEQAKLREAEEQRRKKERTKYRIKMGIIYTIAAALLIAVIVIMSQAEIDTGTSGMGCR